MKSACIGFLLLITFYDFISVIFRLIYPDLQTAVAKGTLSFMLYLPYVSFDLGPELLMTLLLIVFVPLMITGSPLILYASRVKGTRYPRILLICLACLNVILSAFVIIKLKVEPAYPEQLRQATMTHHILTSELILLMLNLLMLIVLKLRVIRRWFVRGR